MSPFGRAWPAFLFASLVLFFTSVVADTEAVAGVPVPTGTVVDFGIFETVQRNVRHISRGPSTATEDEPAEVILIEQTTNIPLKKGIIFGIEWEAKGLHGNQIKITVRVRHPRATKPDGTFSTGFEEIFTLSPRRNRITGEGYYYSLTEDWEMLPGEWSLSVLHEGRMLCEKVFHLAGP